VEVPSLKRLSVAFLPLLQPTLPRNLLSLLTQRCQPISAKSFVTAAATNVALQLLMVVILATVLAELSQMGRAALSVLMLTNIEMMV
jgi:hypothetical protein